MNTRHVIAINRHRFPSLTIVRADGEWQVFPKGCNNEHPTAYFTDDLEDAINTAICMEFQFEGFTAEFALEKLKHSPIKLE